MGGTDSRPRPDLLENWEERKSPPVNCRFILLFIGVVFICNHKSGRLHRSEGERPGLEPSRAPGGKGRAGPRSALHLVARQRRAGPGASASLHSSYLHTATAPRPHRPCPRRAPSWCSLPRLTWPRCCSHSLTHTQTRRQSRSCSRTPVTGGGTGREGKAAQHQHQHQHQPAGRPTAV